MTGLYIRAKQYANEEQENLISLKNGAVVAREDCNLRNVLTRKKARQLPKQVQSGNLESGGGGGGGVEPCRVCMPAYEYKAGANRCL